MCGITGAIQLGGDQSKIHLDKATEALNKRGPDAQGIFQEGPIFLGHRRLSIIDTSSAANQPFIDSTNNYVIVFNGEIYNYKSLRNKIKTERGVTFKTDSDTEVLLQAYIAYGEEVVQHLNGFFAFAIYDKIKKQVFIARDRIGIKPLYYSFTNGTLFFGSEMKALYEYKQIEKEIDPLSLSIYFQINYIPAPLTIYKNVKKLEPGNSISIYLADNSWDINSYYKLEEKNIEQTTASYGNQQDELVNLLEDAIQKRMVADVPLGAFLSGGIDSSIIVSLASKFSEKLNTFSIGFKDNAFFDETYYANLVAEKFKTNHTVFRLSEDDLLGSLQSSMAYIDEPFADSSALLVNILSRETRKHVTVALSGDGGDELFGGYNKHYGEWRMRNGGIAANAVKNLYPIWSALPKSRNGTFSNKMRQLERFAMGSKLSSKERYWRWCAFINANEVEKYFIAENLKVNSHELKNFIGQTTKTITGSKENINDLLLTDIKFILPNDMLTKVDLMSMLNSLEVRVPFLDHRIVEFSQSLPTTSKIDSKLKKKILQDTFRKILPKELYNRPKKGFEVPLLPWFKGALSSLIENDLLNDEFISDQKIFNLAYIKSLKNKIHSRNPGDVHAQIWGLLVFQSWYKNYHCKYA